jgi:hypothetical protein
LIAPKAGRHFAGRKAEILHQASALRIVKELRFVCLWLGETESFVSL